VFRSTKWRHTEECGAARPTGARHAGSDGLKRLVGAAMNADTRPGARPLTPLAAAMLFPSSWTRPPILGGRPGFNHGARADAGGFQGNTYPETNTGHAQGQDGSDGDDDDDEDGERNDAWDFQGSTYTYTKTGHAHGHDGNDGDDDDDDNVFPVTSLRHGLHHLAPVRLTESCRSMGSEPKGVATLFLFEQRAVQDHSVAPLFLTCPGTKEATSKTKDLPTRATTAFKGATKKGVSVACVLVFVLHACLCLCRLLHRGQYDDACLLVFVMHACSCLCRLLQRAT
jgi:hypothetical protein